MPSQRAVKRSDTTYTFAPPFLRKADATEDVRSCFLPETGPGFEPGTRGYEPRKLPDCSSPQLQRLDLNQRPPGYEPGGLPNCPTLLYRSILFVDPEGFEPPSHRLKGGCVIPLTPRVQSLSPTRICTVACRLHADRAPATLRSCDRSSVTHWLARLELNQRPPGETPLLYTELLANGGEGRTHTCNLPAELAGRSRIELPPQDHNVLHLLSRTDGGHPAAWVAIFNMSGVPMPTGQDSNLQSLMWVTSVATGGGGRN